MCCRGRRDALPEGEGMCCRRAKGCGARGCDGRVDCRASAGHDASAGQWRGGGAGLVLVGLSLWEGGRAGAGTVLVPWPKTCLCP